MTSSLLSTALQHGHSCRLLMHSSIHLQQKRWPHVVTEAWSIVDMHIGHWKCSQIDETQSVSEGCFYQNLQQRDFLPGFVEEGLIDPPCSVAQDQQYQLLLLWPSPRSKAIKLFTARQRAAAKQAWRGWQPAGPCNPAAHVSTPIASLVFAY